MKELWKKYEKYHPALAFVILVVLIVTLMILSNGGKEDIDAPTIDAEVEPSIFMDMSGATISLSDGGYYVTDGSGTEYGMASSLYDGIISEDDFDFKRRSVNHICRTYNMKAREDMPNTTGYTYEVVCETPSGEMDTKSFVYGADNESFMLKYTEKITSENMTTLAYSNVINNITGITGYNITPLNAEVNNIIVAGKGVVQKDIINITNNAKITVYVNNIGQREWEVSIAIRSDAVVPEVDTEETTLE